MLFRSAQYNLAVMLLKGQGVQQEPEQALNWCFSAAEQGLAEAQLQLGDLYCAGSGVVEDLTIAITWYEKAAAQGNSQASTKLQALRSCRAG